MKIDKTKNGSELTVTVSGRLDTTTAPELEQSVSADYDGINSLIFDFSDLEYVSSAGLRVLLSAQKKMSKQGSMVIRHVNDTISEIFEVTGFSDILTIEK
ncbi:MAG: STAS domain-containing protein [Lachnospiraceae bacterium]|jgi:anti-sigma B factor antagonist|nr:STAS domain-containing protein [Lachnospiraceae bacterium]